MDFIFITLHRGTIQECAPGGLNFKCAKYLPHHGGFHLLGISQHLYVINSDDFCFNLPGFFCNFAATVSVSYNKVGIYVWMVHVAGRRAPLFSASDRPLYPWTELVES